MVILNQVTCFVCRWYSQAQQYRLKLNDKCALKFCLKLMNLCIELVTFYAINILTYFLLRFGTEPWILWLQVTNHANVSIGKCGEGFYTGCVPFLMVNQQCYHICGKTKFILCNICRFVTCYCLIQLILVLGRFLPSSKQLSVVCCNRSLSWHQQRATSSVTFVRRRQTLELSISFSRLSCRIFCQRNMEKWVVRCCQPPMWTRCHRPLRKNG